MSTPFVEAPDPNAWYFDDLLARQLKPGGIVPGKPALRGWDNKFDGPDTFDISDYIPPVRGNIDGGIAMGGVYLAYNPYHDKSIGEGARAKLMKMRSYGDGITDYKLHIHPQNTGVKRTAAAIIDTCRQDSTLQTAMDLMKFWAADIDPYDNPAPRIVVYPRDGSGENVRRIVERLALPIGSLGVRGNGGAPRFNAHVYGGLWWLAQGSGYDKSKDYMPSYRQQFDPTTNFAFESGSSAEAQELVNELQATLS